MSDKKDDNTQVSQIDMDIDSLLGGANVMVPSAGDEKKNSIFSSKPVDTTFLDKPNMGDNEEDEDKDKDDKPDLDAEGNPIDKKPAAKPAASTEDGEELLNIIVADGDDDEKKNPGGRQRLDKDALIQLTSSLIEKKLLVPFEDDKELKDYSLKDFEELFEANDAERKRKVREEIPGEFINALPPELRKAADYALKGGTDMKGLFKHLAAVEEVRELDPSKEADAKNIIRGYLQATKFGDAEEIEEEIMGWADRDELEAKALKFKPKLDAMSEQQVEYKIREQEQLRERQAAQARVYTDNIYKILEPGELNGLKLDKKTQNMLFSGLVQPNYPSVSGNPTNLLGHLLEKYQYVEPNHALLAEALWLLSDTEGYKNKIREVNKKEVVTDTVRKLKTEERSRIASHTEDDEKNPKNIKKSGLARPGQGFFKR